MFKRSEWILQYKHTTLWRQSSQCSVNTCTETSQCHRKVFKEIITCSYIFINLKCKVLLGLNSRTFTDLFYIDGLNKQSQWKYQKNKYILGYAEFSQTAVILCCLQQSSVKSTPSLQFIRLRCLLGINIYVVSEEIILPCSYIFKTEKSQQYCNN